MRTVKTEFIVPGVNNQAPTLKFSTEVILDDEDDPHEAGKEAGAFLMKFSQGVGDADVDD